MSVRAHLLGLYTVLIASACTAALDATCSAPIPPYPPSANDVEDFVGTPFDVLIIGGGTAGLALASRLAVNSSIVVGVIEAGRLHLNDPIIDAPRLAGTGGASSDYDWNFTSIAQVNAADRNIRITRGKLLGGSSGVNGLAWGRASSPEYDAWVPFADEGWSFDRLLPYFKRSENLSNIPNPYPGVSDPSEGPPSQSSGSGGPVQAGHYSWYPPIVFPIAQAVNNMGVATNPFPDDGNATGLTDSYQSVDVSTSMRSYSANAYYCNQPSKSNLKVLAGAQVSRVLFAGAANTSLFATGVEFIVGSQAFNISASKEVVLSAGTIQTPQILELSGIGSSSILSSAGIPVLQDLPSVGANLQDHVYSLVQYQLVPGQETFDILRNNATFAEEQMALYNATGTGLYANSDSSLVFLPFQALVDGARRGELLAILDEEIANATSSPVVHAQLLQQRDYFVEGNVAAAELIQWSRGIVNPEANESYVDILGGLMHMTSRGSVHIASSDPLAPPVIDPNFLGSKFDQELLMDIVKYIFQLGKTTPFSNYIAALSSPSSIPADDATLLTFLQNSCSDGGHLVGTAVMAPASMGGVVDANFKVYGTQNLRVVDASIFSVNIAAHTQATVYAIAEKAADVMAGAL